MLARQHRARYSSSVPADRFICREEPPPDKGIDCWLELITRDAATNLRGAVQLKSTATAEPNADGSFSHSVEVSNLRYLLNGPCPHYVFWVASKDEQFYAWARDEAERLTRDNPNWMEQETVTIRFRLRLAGDAWSHIADRVRRETGIQRQVNDAISHLAAGEPLTVRIDPAEAAVCTSDDAYQIIAECGMAAVAAGVNIGQWEGLLNTAHRGEPRVRL